ncbi:BRCT domain-containing protein [Thalassococcus lentus]|uniref:BRCT domain-containing protein n=1 Tax=Thalassococcus lentus TaxID=1210524 RepID=A0ABT4XUE1_9RHOB|nr:BRCT domain-containing protein [Thalassococcus lentus]MDA7425574.1 hypothetical protein [Thalassococcus lentus]
MKVCVTGKLVGFTRKEAKAAIESLDAEFSTTVTYDTNYLVAASLKTGKAKKASQIGVDVITEAEFEDFLDAGAFPDNKLPGKPQRAPREWVNNFPDLEWQELPPSEMRVKSIEYQNSDGVVTTRKIRPIATAEYVTKRGLKVEYLKGQDLTTDRLKWFRFDRILSLS